MGTIRLKAMLKMYMKTISGEQWQGNVSRTIKMPNKAFKTDSQRLAFFILSLGLVFTVAKARLGASIAHYLTRRYVI
ncbi:hypothetical protein THF1A12_750011 [Vibrio jasicida]|uniref:DUF3265 domain-containing protein n=1 Tax=Vibrio jasicida TaxID=766224 RepID=A0AAU9QX92_9VIBR|nr:hypothetical protein THF1A12_750011 [Vibrio jasicida]